MDTHEQPRPLSPADVERMVTVDRILHDWFPQTTSGTRLQVALEIAALPPF